MLLADTRHVHLCVGPSDGAHVFAYTTLAPVNLCVHTYGLCLCGMRTFTDNFAFCVCVYTRVFCVWCAQIRVWGYVCSCMYACVGPYLYGVHMGICACAQTYKSMKTPVANVSVA